MDEKMELLICLSASTAANCVPCFDYYFKKVKSAGIGIDDVKKTVDLACKVKTGAGIVMKNSIRDITGQDWDSEQEKSAKADYPCCR
ncbi:MAG TPA: hypothetical protein VEF34_07270 [Syntrophobacteraceae bacterium]|nr:hypothetical protein [Syntrophobacteraceae bacterium]